MTLGGGGKNRPESRPTLARSQHLVNVSDLTRIEQPLSTSGSTIYRVREFRTSDLVQLARFDLELSAAADGRARVASLIFNQGSIGMVLPTRVSNAGIKAAVDDGARSDLVAASG